MPQPLTAKRLTARGYLSQGLRFDLVAGLTVAMVVIPQSMAYASIANVNPIYGIYTAIVTAILGAVAGSFCHHWLICQSEVGVTGEGRAWME